MTTTALRGGLVGGSTAATLRDDYGILCMTRAALGVGHSHSTSSSFNNTSLHPLALPLASPSKQGRKEAATDFVQNGSRRRTTTSSTRTSADRSFIGVANTLPENGATAMMQRETWLVGSATRKKKGRAASSTATLQPDDLATAVRRLLQAVPVLHAETMETRRRVAVANDECVAREVQLALAFAALPALVSNGGGGEFLNTPSAPSDADDDIAVMQEEGE